MCLCVCVCVCVIIVIVFQFRSVILVVSFALNRIKKKEMKNSNSSFISVEVFTRNARIYDVTKTFPQLSQQDPFIKDLSKFYVINEFL